MNQIKKIITLALAAVVLSVLAYQGYLMVRYRLYNGHRAVLSGPAAYEEGVKFAPLGGTSNVPGMVPAAENGILRLYVETETGNVAVYDKRSGQITYAVPPDAEDDPNASGFNKSQLKSQLTLEYFTADRRPARMNSFDHAVALGQIELESIQNGVRCVYIMGNRSSPTGIVPLYITPERLDALFAPIEGTRAYNRNRPRFVESRVAPGHLELSELQRGSMTLNELNEVFTSLGYTEDDFVADMEGSGVEVDLPLHFVIPVDFVLDDDGLVVSVNTAQIKEYADGRIDKIELMRAMGAGHIDEEGYIVVPNGSGSLIHFNGRHYVDEYMQFIYGEDPLLSDYVTLGNTETARLPFFGIKRGERSLLARVESGDALAYLTAGVSGRFNSYNYAYPGFVLRGSMSLEMFGTTGHESSMPVVERSLPAVRLTVRYTPLTSGYDGYSGMARRAREQLIAEGSLPDTVITGDIPFYMDLIGSVKGQKFLAGVSYMGQIPVTRYNEAAEIVGTMSGLGVERQVVNYQGWFNRGYYHDVADRIRPVGTLGRVRDLESLARTLESGGGKLYSDTALQSVPFSSRRYRYTMESSRYYGGGMVAAFGLVNPITLYNTFSMGYMEVMYNVLSPRFLTRYTESYIKAFDRYNLTGTSLRDMGSLIASDRRRTGVINREESKEIILHNFELLAGQGKPLMISGGNLYALAHSDDLIGAPLAHNAMNIVDDEIPFFAMIVHGSLEYAGAPINLSDTSDEREILLRLLEHAASPRFTFTYQSATEMKYTGLNFLYSTYYGNWSGRAAEIYHTVNGVLGPLSDVPMLRHEILPDGLRRVTYENGTQIILNYSDREQLLGGAPIPSKGFLVKEGAA
jgi:hypothetical protein